MQAISLEETNSLNMITIEINGQNIQMSFMITSTIVKILITMLEPTKQNWLI